MKKLSLLIIVLISLSSSLFAQFGDESYARYSIGVNFLSVSNDNPDYKVYGISPGNFFPSINMDYSPYKFEMDMSAISLNFGGGFNSVGYNREINQDSTFFYKASGLSFFTGIEFSYDIIETEYNYYTLSIFMGPQYSMLLFHKYGLNKKVTYNDMDDPQGGLGLKSKLDFTLVNNDSFKLSVFYELDWYFEQGKVNIVNNYLYRTNSIGLAFSFVNGIYNRFRF